MSSSVPAGGVVVARDLVEAHLVVVERADPFGGVDDAALQARVQLAAGQEHGRAARFFEHLAAQARDAHLEPLEVAQAVDLAVEPATHLHARIAGGERHQVVLRVELAPEGQSFAGQQPAVELLAVHAEGHRGEKLRCRNLAGPVVGCAAAHLGHAVAHRVERLERRHQLAPGKHLDLEAPARHLVHPPRKVLAALLQDGEVGRPGGDHAPVVDLGASNRRLGGRPLLLPPTGGQRQGGQEDNKSGFSQ